MRTLWHKLCGVCTQRIDSPPTYRIPDGQRVYAVGDIHGRADLLEALHQQIMKDAAAQPPAASTIVYLGDYIDRGPQVYQVIDALLTGLPPEFTTIPLQGNHEALLLHFLNGDPEVLATWLALGGQSTLLNYQVTPPAFGFGPDRARRVRDELKRALPEAHLNFLQQLQPSLQIGDYFFTHAGVRPGVPLARQSPEDLLWIREEFLNHTNPFGARVVHGHSIVLQPEITPHRIGLDTGAYATGVLTCLVIEADQVRLLPPHGTP